VAQLSAARAAALSSAATYRQIVGDEPGKLESPKPVSKLLPSSIGVALATGAAEHPAILGTQQLVDVAAYRVKASEGALLPSLSAQAGVSRDYTERSPSSAISPNGWS